MKTRATLVFSNHRPETVPLAGALMARHDAVILEEPPEPGFSDMLTGDLDIHRYLEAQDLEYPEFSRRMAVLLRELSAAGKGILQVEPFLECLIEIHERFADGGTPADLVPGSVLHRVYAAERDATKALIDFYEVSVEGAFEATLDAVKRFARADAARFALRDEMRADALAGVIGGGTSFYIEAGQIHFPLFRELRRRLSREVHLGVTFLMTAAVRGMGYRQHLYGPGDLLTLRYRFHPGRQLPGDDLLAARALIYSKLIEKEEITDPQDPYPHTRDELETDAAVRRLGMTDCRRLFPVIRRAGTGTAREMVRHYLATRRPAAPERTRP